MHLARTHQRKARIEIIPMIDVIFFLLVFFMISTLSMTVNRGLPVNLPTAATSQRDLKENLNVTLTQAGELFLNREPIVWQDLGARLKTALASEPELMVIINADGEARHSTVIDVIDELRLSGVTRLVIAVNPDKKP